MRTTWSRPLPSTDGGDATPVHPHHR
jgi:hypothetical protein